MSHSQHNDELGEGAYFRELLHFLVRKQRRMRTRGEEQDEEQNAAQHAAQPSPALRLYRHALESIFGMLDLVDLSQVVAMRRSGPPR